MLKKIEQEQPSLLSNKILDEVDTPEESIDLLNTSRREQVHVEDAGVSAPRRAEEASRTGPHDPEPPENIRTHRTRYDPLRKARAEQDSKRRHEEEAERQRIQAQEERERKLRMRKKERFQVSMKLAQRTERGQPVMKNVIEHLLSKIQKSP
eukprot:CAMPEP_0196658704 /NCGR_PEP_ID=MMETSP1086-20130531/31018_1 /TAXON_ID=77921 /ORGANISM="Cyanoptyche  gloeocystis , Strain SAG4.97" /LENGTH=151 /DNA_ID=CAMNT_0041992379 /DNA_START=282 /DNA_END=737 /DNA_ORIENTATION=-